MIAAAVAGAFTIFSCGSGDDSAGPGTDAGDAGDATSPSDGAKSDAVSSSDSGEGGCGPGGCGLLSFSGEKISTGSITSNASIALALGSAFEIAYPNLLSVRASAGSWTQYGGEGGDAIDIAVGSDGTAWIAYIDASNQLHVAHGAPDADASTYTIESVTSRPAYAMAIAMGSDGVPVVAYAGYDAALTHGAVSIWRRSGSTWTENPIASGSTSAPFLAVALAMHGTEENVLYDDQNSSGTLAYAHADGAGAFTVETVATGVSTILPDELDIAVDSAGGPHVVWHNSYAEKIGGTWTPDTVTAPNFFVGLDTAAPVHIAVSPSGTVTYGALQGGVIWIATRSGGAWSSQAVVRGCDFTQRFDMTYDTTSNLAIAHTCGPDQIDFMLQSGSYPATYATTCTQAGTAACNEANACALNPQGKPCVNASGNSTCIDFPYCSDYIALGMCADATQDAAVMTTCLAALPDAGCEPDSGPPGLILPSVCPPAH